MSTLVTLDSPSHNRNGVNSNTINTVPQKCYLEQFGIPASIAQVFQRLFDCGKLKSDDFDDRAIDALKSLTPQDAFEIVILFDSANLEQISNKSAQLCGSIRYVRERRKTMPFYNVYHEVHKPDEAKMNEIIKRTGYPYECTSGQRKYGPAPGITTPPVADGHEVYIGSIPYAISEDKMIPMMEQCGTIYDLRMMIDSASGRNKGFCFVTFVEDDAVAKAVAMYNGEELVPGIKIRVNPSIPNLKLSVSNLPVDKTSDQLMQEFSKYFEGILTVDVISAQSCLVVFNIHRNASSARRKLYSGRVRPFDQTVLVEWYVSPQEASDEAFKVLYVRNVDKDITESEYSGYFSRFGTIVRLQKYTDTTLFVHYPTRRSAEAALLHFNKKMIGKCIVDVSFAKSSKKEKRDQQRIPSQPAYYDNHMMYPANLMPPAFVYPTCYFDGQSAVPFICYPTYPSDMYWAYDPMSCVHGSTPLQCEMCLALSYSNFYEQIGLNGYVPAEDINGEKQPAEVNGVTNGDAAGAACDHN